MPSTNNALESTNKWIKEDVCRKSVPVAQFLNRAFDTKGRGGFIYNWSRDRNPEVVATCTAKVANNKNRIEFRQEPIITLADDTFAYKYEAKGKTARLYTYEGEMYK